MDVSNQIFMDVAEAAVAEIPNRPDLQPVQISIYRLAKDIKHDHIPDNVAGEALSILQTLVITTQLLRCPGDIKAPNNAHEPTYLDYVSDITAEISNAQPADYNLRGRALRLLEKLNQILWPYSA